MKRGVMAATIAVFLGMTSASAQIGRELQPRPLVGPRELTAFVPATNQYGLYMTAAPAYGRRDPFLPIFPSSVHDLQKAIRGNPKVLRLYAQHYGLSTAKVLKLMDTLFEGFLQEGQYYDVYSYNPTRGTYIVSQHLSKGTRVFKLADGTPVLRADCGNPLSKHPPTRKKGERKASKSKPPAVQMETPPATVSGEPPATLAHTAPEITAETAQTEMLPPSVGMGRVEALAPPEMERPLLTPFSPPLEQTALAPPLGGDGGGFFPWPLPLIGLIGGGGGGGVPPPPIPEPVAVSVSGLLALLWGRSRLHKIEREKGLH